jgi:hypothetical protein
VMNLIPVSRPQSSEDGSVNSNTGCAASSHCLTGTSSLFRSYVLVNGHC